MTLTAKKLALALRAASRHGPCHVSAPAWLYVMLDSAADALEADDEPAEGYSEDQVTSSDNLLRCAPTDAATHGEGGRGVEMSDEELGRTLYREWSNAGYGENRDIKLGRRARELLVPELPSEYALADVIRVAIGPMPASHERSMGAARAVLAYLKERNRG